VQIPEVIQVERNSPKQVLVELNDPQKVQPVVSFINSRLDGWGVPWSGPPVGQVYVNLLKRDGTPIGNFYIGPWFFGRDQGNFWSRRATEEEVAQLEQLLSVPLMEILKNAERR